METQLDPPHPSGMALHLSTPVPDVLYHYTDQHGLLEIVRNAELWATSWDCLNDVEESYVLTKIAKRLLERRLRTETNGDSKKLLTYLLERTNLHPATYDICVSSWSAARDDLSQWRAYSGPDTGYSLGMRGSTLKMLAEKSGGMLAPCIYDPVEQEAIVSEFIEHALKVGYDDDEIYWGDYRAFVLRYSAMFKDQAFSAEREWRIITKPNTYETACFRLGKSTLRTYKPVSLASVDRPGKSGIDVAEVVVGPSPSQELAASKVFYLLRRYCNQHMSTPVSASTIPYRSW